MNVRLLIERLWESARNNGDGTVTVNAERFAALIERTLASNQEREPS